MSYSEDSQEAKRRRPLKICKDFTPTEEVKYDEEQDEAMEDGDEASLCEEEEEEIRAAVNPKVIPNKIKEKKKGLRDIVERASNNYTLTWSQLLERVTESKEEIIADP